MAVQASGRYPAIPLEPLAEGPPAVPPVPSGDTLVLHGHRNCKTTRQTLPFVDRIHRRLTRGAAVAVLQDDRETAEILVREQGLGLPVLLEADPYPLAAALSLEVVPTLFLVKADGTIETTVQAFDRAALEGFAARLGVPGPLFTPEDKAPATKPG